MDVEAKNRDGNETRQIAASTTRRRVVVTGLGLVTPLGTGVEKNWQSLVSGRSAIAKLTRFKADDFRVRIAGEVSDFSVEDWVERREARKMDLLLQYAVASASQAITASGLTISQENAERVGVVFGAGMCGLSTLEEASKVLFEYGLSEGIGHVSPFILPKMISNLAAGNIAIIFGAKGLNFSIASACASGAHSIGEAYRMIVDNRLDVAICGGTEAPITRLGVGGFAAMRALSTRNDCPERASRPFDKDRDGFVIAEGSGAVVLEEREHARARGAVELAEVIGYGCTSDAYSCIAPSPSGEGAARCMRMCLADGGLDPGNIDYISAHATSTVQGDSAEVLAIRKVFGAHCSHLAISSPKSMIGHTLGASGAIEFVYTVLAMCRRVLPPTINYDNSDIAADLDVVANYSRPANIRIAMKNAFGFGGTNASIAVRASSGQEQGTDRGNLNSPV